MGPAPAPGHAFTFGPGAATAPAPESGAARPGGSILRSVLDIPSVRQLLSTPPFRALSLPGVVPQPSPQASLTPRETTGERALHAARSKLGASYRYGSAGPDAFDCSGLVQWSYRQAGVAVPRTSYDQLDSGTPVSLNQLQPGDLVSFYGGEHSGIYEGNGRVIHASTERTGVIESALSQMPVAGARRFR
nr:C40 family peptidase [Nocardia miyunensis]